MATLDALLQSLAALLVACGVPADHAAMAALVLLYLLVTILVAAFLVLVLVRSRRQGQRHAAVEPQGKDET